MCGSLHGEFQCSMGKGHMGPLQPPPPPREQNNGQTRLNIENNNVSNEIRILISLSRAFVSTRPLVHKHVKASVGKWIMETTGPHKHVQIPDNQFFLASLSQHTHFPIIFYLTLLNISD